MWVSTKETPHKRGIFRIEDTLYLLPPPSSSFGTTATGVFFIVFVALLFPRYLARGTITYSFPKFIVLVSPDVLVSIGIGVGAVAMLCGIWVDRWSITSTILACSSSLPATYSMNFPRLSCSIFPHLCKCVTLLCITSVIHWML